MCAGSLAILHLEEQAAVIMGELHCTRNGDDSFIPFDRFFGKNFNNFVGFARWAEWAGGRAFGKQIVGNFSFDSSGSIRPLMVKGLPSIA